MNLSFKIEFSDYRGIVRIKVFEDLQYFSNASLKDEIDHLKKVNNWQKVIKVTPINHEDFLK